MELPCVRQDQRDHDDMCDRVTYFELGDLEVHINQAMSAMGSSPETIKTTFDQLLRFGAKEGDESFRDDGRGPREFIGKNRRIAIRNEYLNPLNDLATGASSAALANLLGTLSTAHLAVVGMLLAGISAWARLRSRVVSLTERQVQVLLMLRVLSNGVREKILADSLSTIYDRDGMGSRRTPWDEERARKTLRTLQQIRDQGGELQTLVKLEGGRWYLNGL